MSGAVALMEEARGGRRAGQSRAGTRSAPSSTPLWDGEEPGLLGSTEWVEAHADELRQKAVAYVNSDCNSRGFLYAAARTPSSPS